MNQDTLEHLYVTGDYLLLLEEIRNYAYDDPSSTLTDIEKAICSSYHSRALIRRGEVNLAENVIHKISSLKNNDSFSLSSLINQTSIINLQITQGNISEALKNGMNTTALVEQRKHELADQLEALTFWSAYLNFLIGIAYYYQFKIDLAYTSFQKSLEVNQTNLFIKAKCLYYLGVVEQEKGNITKFHELWEESLDIFQSIKARQGAAWIICWQGNLLIQERNFSKAKATLIQATELFELIGDIQGLSMVNSLMGMVFYHQGNLAAAEEILEQAFDSLMKIGNLILLSYCFLPLLFLHLESEGRRKAQQRIQQVQELSRNSKNEIVELHLAIAEAMFLKSGPRFGDKALAQTKFLTLLKNVYSKKHPHSILMVPTSDKDFLFLVVFHLVELYLEEFKLTEDKSILLEAQQLIDNHLQHVQDQEFSPKLPQLSFLKAKLLIVDGEIETALVILEQVKHEARVNNFRRLEETISVEIEQIENEFKKWDAATSIKERVEKVQLEDYVKKAQRLIAAQ
ncbi:MAG: hypothetical protein ACE5OZ_22095 [Candidatus Heimdallarchaeota archaeon]